jgi:hypothetical protein
MGAAPASLDGLETLKGWLGRFPVRRIQALRDDFCALQTVTARLPGRNAAAAKKLAAHRGDCRLEPWAK